MKATNFRLWLEHIWQDANTEHLAWHEPEISRKEYFQKYKWWLRREYRHQTSTIKSQ